MSDRGLPTHREWVDYCFTQGYSDFHRYGEATGEEEEEAILKREQRFVSVPPLWVTEQIIELQTNPVILIDRYSQSQIADGIWFIYGVGSEYYHDVTDNKVPRELQQRCYRSLVPMYLDCLDYLSGSEEDGPDFDGKSSRSVETAIYMM
ncbi:MAG: hypothetical protein AAGA25_16445 [Planctomycetota bacterium]